MNRVKELFATACALVLLVLSPHSYAAQTTVPRGKVTVDNVNVSRVGTILYINYDLGFGAGVQSCVTELKVSLDGGQSFSTVPSSSDLTGDVGKTDTRGKKEMRYDIQKVKKEYAGKEIVFDVAVKHVVALKPKVIATVGTTVYPIASSFGAMVGYADKLGGYARVRSNFKSASPTASYTCTSDGKRSDGDSFWGTGASSTSMLNISAGVLLRVGTWFYPYAGVGYGSRTVLWEDSNKQMARVTDRSYKGITFEGGLMFCLGHFTFSIGASNLSSTSGFGLDLGLGVNF